MSLLAFHNDVIDTNPADGAVLTELPATVSVTTAEPLLDVTGTGEGFALELRIGDETYTTSPLTIDGATVSMTTPSALPGGDYELAYQVVGEDGHPISGVVEFTYQGGSSTATVTATEAPTAAPEIGVIDGATWWPVGIVVALAVIGTVIALVVRRRRG